MREGAEARLPCRGASGLRESAARRGGGSCCARRRSISPSCLSRQRRSSPSSLSRFSRAGSFCGRAAACGCRRCSGACAPSAAFRGVRRDGRMFPTGLASSPPAMSRPLRSFFFGARHPDVIYVMKRELYWIPFLGWYMLRTGMIPLDRSKGLRASTASSARRTAAGAAWRGRCLSSLKVRAMLPGCAVLICRGRRCLPGSSGCPVVPVALDSGRVWGRNSFVKRPGCVTVRYLPPLDPSPCAARALGASARRRGGGLGAPARGGGLGRGT